MEETETETETEREGETKTETETETEREWRDRDRDRDTVTEREGETETEIETEREGETETGTETERKGETESQRQGQSGHWVCKPPARCRWATWAHQDATYRVATCRSAAMSLVPLGPVAAPLCQAPGITPCADDPLVGWCSVGATIPPRAWLFCRSPSITSTG
jgi:hypothetical protein